MSKILVCVPCHNRKDVARLCLSQLKETIRHEDTLGLYNDGSQEYGRGWLEGFLPVNGYVSSLYPTVGIQEQRKLHIQDFTASDATHLYFTDHDTIHDPAWAGEAIRLQILYGDLPLCLYNTQAHVRIPGNTIDDSPSSEVIIRRVAPGVSYLLTRSHVEKIIPHLHKLQHFDWEIPAILGNFFLVSRTCYVDHIGWGGQRHPPAEGLDGGDRALAPTPYLVQKRAEIVAQLAHLCPL